MLDQQLLNRFNQPGLMAPNKYRQQVMGMHLAVLMIDQYLALFRPTDFPTHVAVTYDDLFADKDNCQSLTSLITMAQHLIIKTPSSNLFMTIKRFLNHFDLDNPSLQAVMSAAFDRVDAITTDEPLIQVLQNWYDTYVQSAKGEWEVQSNYVSLPVMDQIVAYFGAQENKTIYTENIGHRAPQVILGGQTSTYIEYTTTDEITKLFGEIYQFVTNVATHKIIRSIKPHHGRCDIAVINLGAVSQPDWHQLSQTAHAHIPTRNQAQQFSITKLQRLMAPHGKVAIIANRDGLAKIKWDNGSSMAAMQSGLIDTMITLPTEQSADNTQDVSILFLDMAKAN